MLRPDLPSTTLRLRGLYLVFLVSGLVGFVLILQGLTVNNAGGVVSGIGFFGLSALSLQKMLEMRKAVLLDDEAADPLRL
jgi:hypothetical protein